MRQFKAHLQTLHLIWEDGAATTLDPQLIGLTLPYVVFQIRCFYNLSRFSNNAWCWETDNALVSQHCWCCNCGRWTWHPFSITIMVGWCICLQCESLEKSTVFQKITGLLFCSVIFAFCLKVLVPSQQFKKCFLMRINHMKKNMHPVCRGI